MGLCGAANPGALRQAFGLDAVLAASDSSTSRRAKIGDGTVGNPAWSFAADATMGLYRPGANQLGLAVGGVAKMAWGAAEIDAYQPLDMNSQGISAVATLAGPVAGCAISSVASLAGIAAGASLSAVGSIAGIAAGASVTNLSSIAGVGAGVAVTNVASVAGIGVGASYTSVASIAGIAGGAAVSEVLSIAGLAAGMSVTDVSSVAGIAAGASYTSVASIAGVAGGAAVSEVLSIAGLAAGMAVTNVASVAGIGAGAAYTSVASLAGVAGGAALSDVLSVAGLAAGMSVTNVTSVAGIAAGAAYTNVASVAGIAGGAAISDVLSLAGLAAGMGVTNVSSLAGIAAGATVTAIGSIAGVAAGMAFTNLSSMATPTITGAAGIASGLTFTAAVTQTNTAGYRIWDLSWTHNTVGSGAKHGIYMNAPAGFVGSLVDLRLATAAVFSIGQDGQVTSAGSMSATGSFIFADDPDTMFRRRTSNECEVRCAGYDIMRWSTSGAYLETGDLTIDSQFGRAIQTTTLGAGAATLAITRDIVVLTGDGAGNTLTTITGGITGQVLRILFVDGLVQITDDNTHAANTVDLSAAFTSADDMVLTLFFDGTSWYECGRSPN